MQNTSPGGTIACGTCKLSSVLDFIVTIMLIWFTYFYLPGACDVTCQRDCLCLSLCERPTARMPLRSIARAVKHENYDRNASITEVLVEDYTVAVRNVPREATATRIAEFFSVYGKVSEGLCLRSRHALM